MTFNVRRTASGCLLAGVLLMPMVVSRSSAQITSKEKATGGSAGGKCQVTAGLNKGKTGTLVLGAALNVERASARQPRFPFSVRQEHCGAR
jgi:hypothetical protein